MDYIITVSLTSGIIIYRTVSCSFIASFEYHEILNESNIIFGDLLRNFMISSKLSPSSTILLVSFIKNSLIFQYILLQFSLVTSGMLSTHIEASSLQRGRRVLRFEFIYHAEVII